MWWWRPLRLRLSQLREHPLVQPPPHDADGGNIADDANVDRRELALHALGDSVPDRLRDERAEVGDGLQRAGVR